MLGIDVSKAALVCTLLDPDSQQTLWEGTVPNTAAGVRQLLKATPVSAAWVVEPTGQYSRVVVQTAQDAERDVRLAPPRAAKAFLQAIQSRAKTDRLDSWGLARFGLAMPLRPYPRKRAAVEQVEQLLAARKGLSRSLASLRQQRQSLPYAAGTLDAAIAALSTQQAALDRQVAQLTLESETWSAVPLLRTIPGIGPVTAAAVAACLSSREFAHPDQFVAYIGLDTRVRESGQHRGRRTISKQGDAELRRLLYLCAQANLRSRDADNPFKRQYERERAKGLPTTAALCAVARKLARTCWSIAKYQTPYAASRVNQQPGTGSSRAVPAALDAEP